MQYEDIDEDISGRIGDQVAICCSAGHVPLCGRDMVFGLTLRHTATCARYYIVFCSPRMEHKRDCKDAARPTGHPRQLRPRRSLEGSPSRRALLPRSCRGRGTGAVYLRPLEGFCTRICRRIAANMCHGIPNELVVRLSSFRMNNFLALEFSACLREVRSLSRQVELSRLQLFLRAYY
jgi:hypothetical protein